MCFSVSFSLGDRTRASVSDSRACEITDEVVIEYVGGDCDMSDALIADSTKQKNIGVATNDDHLVCPRRAIS